MESKRTIYVLGNSKENTLAILEYLKDKGFCWISPDHDWNDDNLLKGINLDHNNIFHVNTIRRSVEPIPTSILMGADIQDLLNRAVTFDELKGLTAVLPEKNTQNLIRQTKTDDDRSETGNIKTEDPVFKKRQPLKFARISGKQIVARFVSKNHKDEYGNPLKLCKILLPRSELSQIPIKDKNGTPVKNAAIIIPEYTISKDKFDETKNIIGIRPSFKYFVIYDTGEKDKNNYAITDQVHVSGDQLLSAFKYKSKDKNLSDRIDHARENKETNNEDKTVKREAADKTV